MICGSDVHDLIVLAAHMARRRDEVLDQWRKCVKSDGALTSGRSMPRSELNDHVPGLLRAYETALARSSGQPLAAPNPSAEASAHGLHRWQQGYDLSEVTRELGLLNEVVVDELDQFAAENASASTQDMRAARRLWAAACTQAIAESASEYFRLRQVEAAGHVRDLERAVVEVRELEHQRAQLWMQAAHDLRGNLGVVSNATAGLSSAAVPDILRADFLHLLQRNVRSLHHLLDDVTSLARLQAGQEIRNLASIDVGRLLHELCEGLTPLAEHAKLYLRFSGPLPFVVQGDAVKIRRLAQNLVLNAVKYTQRGGVVVEWGPCGVDDRARWSISIEDTGPGFDFGPSAAVAGAIQQATQLTASTDPGSILDARTATLGEAENQVENEATAQSDHPAVHTQGEGIGLSIVKRLCELLDATIELESSAAVGTRFRILLPRQYVVEPTEIASTH